MKARRRVEVVAVLFLFGARAFAQQTKPAAEITPAGRHLGKVLTEMDVEHHWLAGDVVKWRTGEPLNKPTDGKRHSHCSAFVAAAAAKLGVYILRPPEHSTLLLANAQYDWLQGEGQKQGWRPVASGQEAQHLANRGYLVVAVYKESNPKRSGHIAIVRPSSKSEAKVREDGPQIIQAGMENHASTSLKEGFKHHRTAFRDGLIRFFAHSVPETSGVSSGPR
jgi:hypothetical protein